jgi:hypothetical protein
MMSVPKDPLNSREHVWLTAWIAVAASSNITKADVAAFWADACLREFDKRFGQKS